MTSTVRPEIRAFFEQYAKAGDTLDTVALNDCFHEVFLNLDPTNAAPIARDLLIRSLPLRQKLFDSIGARGMDLTTLTETPLDDRHALAETTWAVRFGANARSTEPLEFGATFVLRLDGGRWRIVVYLNHHDVVASVRSRAVASASAEHPPTRTGGQHAL
ncbi:hypothetical protein JOF29_003756 [Kribbella aluminosa]|uniref:Ketosteroid isomerase-like protein n=1 Tax=Kribbella aluminosa TaxID=416017 RepID=A0ABS4UM10_9ACTN|nr:hypothetical protein [Kribbella aluminosa]MBP2352673.1 hypothetical protein [Kribbella aluminosa]